MTLCWATGIVSVCAYHVLFGIGAYGIAVATTRMGPTVAAVGVGGALLLSLMLLLSLAIGLFSAFRGSDHLFAMITLAVASAFQTLASQLSDTFTGGEDGLTFKYRDTARHEPFEIRSLGEMVDRQGTAATCCLRAAAGAAAAAHRQQPFGRVLQAIPRNDSAPRRLATARSLFRTTPTRCRRLFAAWRRASGALAALHRARHLALPKSCSTFCSSSSSAAWARFIARSSAAMMFVLAQNYLQDADGRAFEGWAPGIRSSSQPVSSRPLAALARRCSCCRSTTGCRCGRPAGALRSRSASFTSNHSAARPNCTTPAGHAETVIAWHGLARTCRDMDDIAAHLATRWRVICLTPSAAA